MANNKKDVHTSIDELNADIGRTTCREQQENHHLVACRHRGCGCRYPPLLLRYLRP